MVQRLISYRWVVILGTVSLMLTGCFQSINSDPNATPESLPIRTTEAPFPTQTLLPTYTPFPTFTPFPTLGGETSFSVESDPLNSSDVVQEPTLDPLFQPIATEPPFDVNINPNLLTATAIVQAATDAAATLTATFTIPDVVIPTFTATFDVGVVQPVVPTLPGSDCIYEVRTGDNMWQISQTFGVLMVDIASASGVTVQGTLLVGQRLTIPNCGTTGAIPPATSTPRFTSTPDFATGGQVGVTSVAPFTLAPVNCTVAGGITHTVSQGETLFQIAQRYGTSLECIIGANPEIANPGLIFFGQQIYVP